MKLVILLVLALAAVAMAYPGEKCGGSAFVAKPFAGAQAMKQFNPSRAVASQSHRNGTAKCFTCPINGCQNLGCCGYTGCCADPSYCWCCDP